MRFGSSALFSVMALVMMTGYNTVSAQGDREQGALRGGQERNLTNDSQKPSAIELMAESKGKKNEGTRRVLVRYKEGHKKQTYYAMQDATLQRATGEPEIQVEFDFEELNTYVITATPDEIAVLESNPDIESIQDDVIRTPMHIDGSNADLSKFFSKSGNRRLAEDRPYGIDLVGAPDLWEQDITGAGIKVCVIDTGIDQDHPDFVTENLSGVDTGSLKWSEDGCGHGTHVSGTVAAKKDNKGVVGVAPDAEIFTVRVFGGDCGYAYSSGIYDAALRCKENGARIISMSLGGPEASDLEAEAFASLFNDDDVLVVAAAGNDGNTAKSYPASYSSVMSVAAVRENKQLAAFSQRNDEVDIAAPGVGVLSTFPVGGCRICRWNRRGYGAIDGTSMSTPHVSGVAALLLSAAPDTSAVDLRNAIEASAEDLGDEGRDDSFGHGLVQAGAALDLLNGGTGSGNPGEGETPPETDPITECSDIAGWYDADGEEYDCLWYSQGTRCSEYGDRFANEDGFTAQDACCSCGGGVATPTEPIGECNNFPEGWHDSFSSFYNCAWYAEGVNCDRFGDSFANEGKTANQACCACGGGRTV